MFFDSNEYKSRNVFKINLQKKSERTNLLGKNIDDFLHFENSCLRLVSAFAS